jgi:putative hydrolase of the HAD superfamily
MLESLGVTELADAVILSCEIGSVKPSPEIYLTALEDLGVAAADAVMIDDQPAFCAGAEAVGVRAIRMVRGDPGAQAAAAAAEAHFPVVRSLLDVPPLL